jgi:GrpB-like predicted nucleotidyltransferase (UPF0157 family)
VGNSVGLPGIGRAVPYESEVELRGSVPDRRSMCDSDVPLNCSGSVRAVDHSERETYLNEVLIGGREQRRILIVKYDLAWPARFRVEERRIRRALGTTAIRVEHTGSTSVPGLAAKPIIDILATVVDPADERLVSVLEREGYRLRVREPDHRMFRTPELDVHVHVWSDSDPEVGRVLTFRDRLRSSPSDRESYEALKRQLAAQEWRDMNDYADAKSDLIEQILAASRASG